MPREEAVKRMLARQDFEFRIVNTQMVSMGKPPPYDPPSPGHRDDNWHFPGHPAANWFMDLAIQNWIKQYKAQDLLLPETWSTGGASGAPGAVGAVVDFLAPGLVEMVPPVYTAADQGRPTWSLEGEDKLYARCATILHTVLHTAC